MTGKLLTGEFEEAKGMGMRQVVGNGGMDEVVAEAPKRGKAIRIKGREVPELYQVVIECRDEGQQRELFERMRAEGLKLRLLVL